MAPAPGVAKAFKAMKCLGISENKVKPVLKKLLKLYDKNWALIESENYRVLADAIFEEEDNKVSEDSEQKKPKIGEDDFEEESVEHEEPLRPLKRLRRGQQSVVSPSPRNCSPGFGGTSSRRPLVEGDELPASSSQQHSQDKAKSPQFNAGNVRLDNQHHGYKGKAPVSPQGSPTQKRRDPERASALCIRDPTVETGVVPLPKKGPGNHELIKPKDEPPSPKKGPGNHELIKPKDEPFTDDMFTNSTPQYEAPIAVIRPDSLSHGDSLPGPVCQEPPAPHHVQGECRGDGVLASLGEGISNCKLASIPVESLPSFDIAASSMGEEESRSVTPTSDLLQKSAAPNALLVGSSKENRFMPSGIPNGSVDQVPPLIPRPLRSLSGLYNHIGISKEIVTNGAAESGQSKELKDLECSSLDALVPVPLCRLTPDELRAINDVKDITQGEESVAIPWINEINNECPPSFYYISQNLVFQNACVNFTLSRIGVENCCSSCFGNCLQSGVTCACAHQNGRFVYTSEGLLEEEFLEDCISMTRSPQQQNLLNCRDCPLERSRNEGILEPCKGHLKRNVIKECWSKCGCYKQCGNRVVQRGISCKLQV